MEDPILHAEISELLPIQKHFDHRRRSGADHGELVAMGTHIVGWSENFEVTLRRC